jgi:hypothetical protein
MKLSYRQQRQLRLIEASVRRSDPHLGAMFGIFGRLYPGQDLPGAEQLPDQPAGRGRLRRAAALFTAALITMAVAISVLLGKAVITATARRRVPAPVPVVPREPTRPRTDGSALGDPAGRVHRGAVDITRYGRGHVTPPGMTLRAGRPIRRAAPPGPGPAIPVCPGRWRPRWEE